MIEVDKYDRIHVVDSHTGGEPTRVVVEGGPDLGSGVVAVRRERLKCEFDSFRSAVVNEPRGSDVIVGALLCPPAGANAVASVVFFNNVGYLGMCVHGMIGVVQTLAHLKRIGPGEHIVETPVGDVQATLQEDGQVSVRNVVSYRHATRVELSVPGVGTIHGDIAWGGNWFFLVDDHGQDLTLDNTEQLTDFCWRIRRAISAHGVTGANGEEIDHIELFGTPTVSTADSKNFVLCPGKAYDRSPCGTGTSAKLACLVADGKLKPGQWWRQESIVGTVFEGTADLHPEGIVPTIRGSAFITAEATLLLDPDDPFRRGIRS